MHDVGRMRMTDIILSRTEIIESMNKVAKKNHDFHVHMERGSLNLIHRRELVDALQDLEHTARELRQALSLMKKGSRYGHDRQHVIRGNGALLDG